MQAFGMLLLAAATAGDGFGYADADVGGKKWLRSSSREPTSHATGAPPYNAAALAGGGGMGADNGRRFIVTKSQIYFLDPNGMQIGWQNGTGPNGERTYLPAQLTVPARYNFNQGFIYRLKITNIPGRPARLAVPDDRGRPDHPGNRRLPGPQRDPGAVHRRGFRPGGRRRQLRDQGHLPARSQVSGTGDLRCRNPGLDPARAGRRPDSRGRQARHDPLDRAARCHRPREPERAVWLGPSVSGPVGGAPISGGVVSGRSPSICAGHAAAGRRGPRGTCPGQRDPRSASAPHRHPPLRHRRPRHRWPRRRRRRNPAQVPPAPSHRPLMSRLHRSPERRRRHRGERRADRRDRSLDRSVTDQHPGGRVYGTRSVGVFQSPFPNQTRTLSEQEARR